MASGKILCLAFAACLALDLPALGASVSAVYAFKGGSDGEFPVGGVRNQYGFLIGTTAMGGAYQGGTIFSLTSSGEESVVHSFDGTDGGTPGAPLTHLNNLYGTTVNGGEYNAGVVYSLGHSGSEKVLYSFKGGADGSNPFYSELVNVDGTLFGTTRYGGSDGCAHGCGTVFSVTPQGAETIVYSFQGGSDGKLPAAGLTYWKHMLFGTTSGGGAHGGGTVFSVTTSGVERVLHSFGKKDDGSNPQAGLIEVDGTFYGTTEQGGTSVDCDNVGCGTVFSVLPSGSEHVIHSFSYSDGSIPQAPLVNAGGTLYGTTHSGGSENCGTLYSVTTAGSETVLYSFSCGSDGAYPSSGLTNVDGTL
jgi:uncharacterized repeat protein (TIGR03803 family)